MPRMAPTYKLMAFQSAGRPMRWSACSPPINTLLSTVNTMPMQYTPTSAIL